jgi:diguanylate cyclase (GGDEF)-like protein/PAS domain S-box-containing protein
MSAAGDAELHPLLARQLRRLGLSRDVPPAAADAWAHLLDRVGAAYADADDTRYTLERSIDISSSEMRDAHDLLRRREQFVRAVVERAADGILTIGHDGIVVWANGAAERMFRWAPGELVGTPVASLWPATQSLDGADGAHEVQATRRDGTRFAALAACSEVVVDGAPGNVVVIHDISERKVLEDRLWFQARHDELTGLPNRVQLHDLLRDALLESRHGGLAVAALFCDLDRFKVVNDSLGHDVGDGLLVLAADRLRDAVRSGDVVARLGGDEFVVLCPGVGHPDEAFEVATRIIERFQAPFRVGGHDVVTTASIGLAVTGPRCGTAAELLRDADLAMYRAKQAGRGGVARYDDALHRSAAARLELEHDLRRAVHNGELVLHYQPVVDVATGVLDAVEALIRWHRPGVGLVGPAEFLDCADELGLMGVIDDFVVHEACRQAVRWQAETGVALGVAVNLSDHAFRRGRAVGLVHDALTAAGLAPQRLGVEVTEHLLDGGGRTRLALVALRELGVEILLDDFGTDHASLARVEAFPLDAIKLDRSLVKRVGQPRMRTVVRAAVDLAHGLGLRAVAEGVERPDQLRAIRDLGCDAAQGFLLGRPVPADTIRALLAAPTLTTAPAR